MKTSSTMQKYFSSITDEATELYKIATQARKKGFDPTTQVDIKLADNLAQRVVGLISVVAPKIEGSGVVERIEELEKEYAPLDWRVAMQIALEVAQQKFVTFDNTVEAIEVGIRIGFAYVTVGIVSSPLEGFTKIELKKRLDNQEEYFAMHFAGPVRNAGGTAAAVSVIIADYVRKHLGYAKYDPNEKEQQRCYTETMDYHDRVTNLQYVPSKEESLFMCANCPIEIDGDPSEKFEVSNFKDLPRINPNRLRSGFCLIHSSCLPLKAPKLWKQVSKWKDEMGMQDWAFLKEFLDIQKQAKSQGASSQKQATKKTKEEENIYPVYTYISDLVGGRPVISHPLRAGGFRLRYGRSRTSGFSAQSIHPASMHVMDDFIATATQLKVERPGKAAAFTSCDSIEGPIVELHSGDVVHIKTVSQAKELDSQVKSILYLGDVLINYGDFYDRAHTLLPPGYCEEWWELEVEKATDKKYEYAKLSDDELFTISEKHNVPLHPSLILYWKLLTDEQFSHLIYVLKNGRVKDGKWILAYDEIAREALHTVGLEHKAVGTEFFIIEKKWTHILLTTFDVDDPTKISVKEGKPLDAMQIKYKTKDKAGIFIGSRMGRPEKAKMRKMAGHPWGVAPQEIREEVDGVETKRVITEHQHKLQLREKYQINANKDGTIRYDASEVPITHFKPKEIRITLEQVKKLGYVKDIKGQPITDTNQVIELFPQDIIIPCCTESPNEPADEVLYRVANYIDELLVNLYHQEPIYNLKSKSDLIGQLVFCLAPHTSAATTGRIIGFTKTQGLFEHPMMHAAQRRDCDGDETCFFLLMDGFLNFSTKYLPQRRGGTMDAPLVLTNIINPMEVDDMVFNLDVAWKYPLEFYEACCEFKKPWDVKVPILDHYLGEERQFEGMGFTHDTNDFNEGVLCSAYKTLPSMQAKVDGQMGLARKIKAVDEHDVAQIVIDKHFLRDIMGNLRKFSTQEFRCVKCNTKYRRPPIRGKCEKCGMDKIIFTISRGSVVKYLELSKKLSTDYDVSEYTRQVLEVLQLRVDGVFGREKEQQKGLSEFFG